MTTAPAKNKNFRLLPSKYGKWIVGSHSISLASTDQLTFDGNISSGMNKVLELAGTYEVPANDTFFLTVMTSSDCNLGCAYCFQNTAQNTENPYKPYRIAKKSLTPQIIEDIIVFTHHSMNDMQLDKSYLSVFGGEPLLNLSACEYLLKAYTGNGLNPIGITMITNGVLLTPQVAHKLSDAGLRDIQVTLDGDQSHHDSIRVNHAGKGTFTTILNNIEYVLNKNLFEVNMRVNVTTQNVDSLNNLVNTLAERIEPAKCSLDFSWVKDTGIGFQNNISSVNNIIEKILNARIKAATAGFAYGYPANKKCVTCGTIANPYAAVVNADGSMFSCYESSGQQNEDIGHISHGFFPKNILEERWTQCKSRAKENMDPQYSDIMGQIDGLFLDYLKENDYIGS